MYLYLNSADNHSIIIDRYKIVQLNPHVFQTKHVVKHTQNAYAQFDGKQEDSQVFKGGIAGYRHNPLKRKLIDDILLIGSLITGSNWCLFSRRKSQSFPLIAHPYLEIIQFGGKDNIEDAFKKALNKIKDNSWQNQYENGFHLRMLLNHSNITNSESRFLSNIVIWELLYPHLKNPKGATPDDESNDLTVIMNFILDSYWPKRKFKGKNIFVALRNQLAHSGKLPINRTKSYVEPWMTHLDWETENGLTQPLFCKQSGITLSTFVYWRCQLLKQKNETTRFAPVKIVKENSPDLQIQIRLVIGHVVCLPIAIGTDEVTKLIHEIGLPHA